MCFLSVYIICIRRHRSVVAAAGGTRDEFAFRERLEVDVAEVEARGSALALALDTPWWRGCGTPWWVHGDVLSRNITEWRGMAGRRCSACAF